MTALLLGLLVKATAVVAAAFVVDVAFARRASAAARHLVWSLAMIALLALPVAVVALPELQVRIPVDRATVVAIADPVHAGSTDLTAGFGAVTSVARAVTPGRSDHERSRRTSPLVVLAVIYLAGLMLLIVRLALEPLALRRITFSAAEIVDAEWRVLFARCIRQIQVTRPVRMMLSAGEVMPFTFGTIAPAIVLPPSSDGWTDDRRRAVLLHELAHIARRDCLLQRITALACALYWPHPGVWWGARRLRIEGEHACDDRVIGAGTDARDYASHLLGLARSLGAAPAPSTALGMARARQLERRLLAVLDAARDRGALGGRGVAIAAGMAAAFVVVVAALRAAVVPAGSPTAATDAASTLMSFVQQDLTGAWELRRTQDPKMVQITVRTAQGTHGRRVALERLAGLPVEQISAPNATVHVPIRREAGTFTVDGVCRAGVCGGTYTFDPDPAFADALAKRGIGRPTPPQQFALAIADVGTGYVDALAAAGYATPDVRLLARAAQHGVDAEYLRAMTGLGYRLGALDRLVVLRDHGVDPEYVRGMAANGLSGLSADELVRTRDHGVDPEYLKGLTANGIPQLTLDELVRARDHGVDPEYVGGLSTLGYRALSIDALVKARDHGVNPQYVRGMIDAGCQGATLDDLIRMRDHGVDPEYVRRLQRSGVSRLAVDEIIRRRDRGQ
jgi:beta-lactamase regulating signal transducer with metallopeptidase domain